MRLWITWLSFIIQLSITGVGTLFIYKEAYAIRSESGMRAINQTKKEINCIDCGKKIVTYSPIQKRCAACGKIKNNERAKAAQKAKRQPMS